MDPILSTIGANIRRLRMLRGWTQTQLATVIDSDANLLGRIERGQQNVTLLTLARIARGLEVELDTLVVGCPPAPTGSQSRAE